MEPLVDLLSRPLAFAAAATVLGLAVGSFLNVVIHRLPKMLERQWQRECAELRGETPAEMRRYDLFTPASSCPQCERRIRPWENVPVVSYLALRGRCAGCGSRISARYPVVELLTGILTGYAAWHFGPGWSALAVALFLWAMIALAFIDLDTFFLPDCITLPLLWAGLVVHVLELFPQPTLVQAVIGAVAGYLALWSVFWLFKLATGKEGMGYGDFKLLAAIGAWLGWKALPLVILLSSFVGAVAGIALLALRRQGRDVPIPFGPYLVVAGLIALFWGGPITQRYLALF